VRAQLLADYGESGRVFVARIRQTQDHERGPSGTAGIIQRQSTTQLMRLLQARARIQNSSFELSSWIDVGRTVMARNGDHQRKTHGGFAAAMAMAKRAIITPMGCFGCGLKRQTR